ncbi:hypothetical protein MiTe_00169 [Microcystis aeruginosa NIES-2520]|jgi:hypothetical protein|uniref:Uncharacterized protein n=2 Tax=Microcystis TaxID=1125 RepID=A0A5A5R9W9_MICAE|nr:hypothetical protein MiTe_00169 [Microcystis aeruginosa NIES-2520]
MKAEDFDRKFDDGENIIEYLDLTKIKRSNSEEQTIAFEFPSWMVEALEQESQRRDLPLQAIVKDWIEEKLASSNSLQTRLFVTWYGSSGWHKSTKSLPGKRFKLVRSRAKTIDKNR